MQIENINTLMQIENKISNANFRQFIQRINLVTGSSHLDSG